ncbi:MAG: chemotaxis protein CheB, partial [Myxococcales bacterium]
MVAGLVVIGTSLGGLNALRAVLGGLPAGYGWPVVIVQHRSAEDVGDTLPVTLQRGCALPVREVEDKDPLEGGRVYIGPADYHLLIEPEGLALSTEGRVFFARPSINVLFESAAVVY